MRPMFDPTQEWEDFYPVDWLINGGPPFEGGCPKVDENVSEEAQTFSIHADVDNFYQKITWSVSQLGYVLFKSTDYQDIVNYLRKFKDGLYRIMHESTEEVAE
jgi:hypothetical protein